MAAYKPVNRVADYATEYTEEGREYLSAHPWSSVVVAFGLGMASGFAIVALLSEGHETRTQTVAHRVGQQLLDAMSSVLPDTISRNIRASCH